MNIQRKVNNKTEAKGKHQQIRSETERSWLALYFPNLPLEIFERRHQATDQAMVILENNRVCSRNAAAIECGIELGTTLPTAHSIVTPLMHQPRDPEAESKRLTVLANTLYRFSSYVSIQAPDCVMLEIAGSLKLFGSHSKLMGAAVDLCRSIGHQARGCIAQTPWAAIALARSGVQSLHHVPLGEAGLDLAGIHAQVIERFDNMGIYTLGPLLDLPAKQLGRRFGKALLTYLGQLTGSIPDPRQAIAPAQSFHEVLHLLQPIANKQDLIDSPHAPMFRMSQDLQQWLIAQQQGCERARWRFIGHTTHCDVSICFAQAKQNSVDLLRISNLKLEQASLPEEVLGVELQTTRLQNWHNRSQNLFSFDSANHPSVEATELGAEAFELINEVNARLGEQACQGIVSLDQHTPEAAWCNKAINAFNGYRQVQSATSTRPLWLFDPPRQISRAELTILQGPERIVSGWWQKEVTARDYYIAKHQMGAECWVYKVLGCTGASSFLNESQWYLHGYFG